MARASYRYRNGSRRRTPAEREADDREALDRARQGFSPANDAIVVGAFADRGIADVQPRENVLTYKAWRAAGRQVRRGQKGVRITTYAPVTEPDPQTGADRVVGRRPVSAVVFHVSQTDSREG